MIAVMQLFDISASRQRNDRAIFVNLPIAFLFGMVYNYNQQDCVCPHIILEV